VAATDRPLGSDKRRFFSCLIVLACLAIVSVIAPSTARCEEYAVVQGYVHAFNNNVTVYSTVFALNKDFDLDTSAYVKYTVDVIRPGLFEGEDEHGSGAVSGASTAASGGGNDARHEFTAGISHNLLNFVGVELYYDYSLEKDFTSSTPTISLKKELFGKNTTLTFGYSRNMDDVSGTFMASEQKRTTDNYYFGLTQVLSPVMIAQAGYTLIKSEGFQSEGVRLVPINGVAASTCTDKSATCVDEAFPDNRTRKAYMLGLNRYFRAGPLGGPSSVKLSFRYYTDDWDIDSYTAEAEYYKYITEQDLLRFNYRFYTQSAAFFYKDNYVSADVYKTTSPQHREFNTHLGGVKISHTIKENPLTGVAGGGVVEGKYELYGESTGVLAHIVMASFRLLF